MKTLERLNMGVLVMSLLSFLLCSTAVSAEESVPRKVKAVPTPAAPVIDGILDDACWRGEPVLKDFCMKNTPDALHPEQTKGWVCYDKEYLYIGVQCDVHNVDTYKKLLAESAQNMESGIRFYVDTKHARAPSLYEEYRLNANGTTGYIFSPGTGRDGRKVRPIDELKIDTLVPAYYKLPLRTDYIESAVSFTEDSYLIEAAIPFAMMHLSRETASTWGFNVQRIHDIDSVGKEGERDARSFWGTSSDDPEFFGELELDADFSQYYWDLHFVPPQPGDRAIEVQLGNETGKAFTGEMELRLTRRSADGHSHRPDGETFVYRQPAEMNPGGKTQILFAHTVREEDVEARYQFTLSDSAGHPVILGSTSKKDLTPGDDGPAPEPTGAERKLGYIVYQRPYTVPMTYRSVPKGEERTTELHISGCPGEYVPVTFSLYPLEHVSGIQVSASDLLGPDGAVIPSASVDIRYVTYQSVWQEKWIAYSFKAQENLLRHFDNLNLTTGRSQRFWLTAKLADGQNAGKYAGTVTISSSEGDTRLPLNLTVMPFKLANVEDMGYFMYANGALTRDPERARKVARDMREHGMNTATIYYWAQTDERNGEHRLVVDEPVGYSAETRYTVDRSRGVSYSQVMNILIEEGFARKVPLIDIYAVALETSGYQAEMIVELDRIYKERGWPQVVYYLVDEYDQYEEKTKYALKRSAELKKHGLDLKYTTAIVGREAYRERTDAAAHLYDVWILGTPSADLIVKGLSTGKELWSYGWTYSHNYSTADLRHYFGRYLWKTGLKGASLWCYNYGRFRDRFWSYPDGPFSPAEHYLAFSYVWYEDDEIIPTARWEAVREGIDDYRYLRTLERFAVAAAAAGDEELRAAGNAGLELLDEIRDNVALVVSCAEVADEDKPSLADIDTERRRVAEAILRILKANGLGEDE